MARSKIEWTERTWNPLAGCTKVSPGCEHCYAARMAHRLGKNPNKDIAKKYGGLTTKTASGKTNWTGKIHYDKGALNNLTNVPSFYFVNSMSDLFHPAVEFSFIDSVFEVMGWHREHIFQVLTKNPQRALEYYRWTNIFNAFPYFDHVWLGVSVENQKYADLRIPILLQIPAKVRWISAEPLLGNIFLSANWMDKPRYWETGTIDWVVVGGESGPGSRIMEQSWVRSIRDQCLGFKVPFFFKQWGEYIHIDQVEGLENKPGKYYNSHYRKGIKKDLGKTLDGKEWEQYPERPKLKI